MKKILFLLASALSVSLNILSAEPIGRGINPEMVPISTGSFIMGSKSGDSDEAPAHEVRITRNFYLGKYEVTFERYDLYCAATGAQKPDDEGWGRGDRPVINVSWDDAKAYAAWLSKATGKKYRLPTEAEWEYAARSGSTAAYSFGDDKSALGDYAWHNDNSGRMSHEIGSRQPNAWGLYDMHGNVWEWCEDAYADNYASAPANGSANKQGGKKVARGGSWISSPEDSRSANRFGNDPSRRAYNIGFRLAEDQ